MRFATEEWLSGWKLWESWGPKEELDTTEPLEELSGTPGALGAGPPFAGLSAVAEAGEHEACQMFPHPSSPVGDPLASQISGLPPGRLSTIEDERPSLETSREA